MVSKTITYTDYQGTERTETFFFNLTKAELIEMEYSTTGGLSAMIDKLISAIDIPEIIKIFKELIQKSYGVVSADGRRFIKNEEELLKFTQTEAYSELFIELSSNADFASEFITAIMPSVNEEEKEQIKKSLTEKGL